MAASIAALIDNLPISENKLESLNDLKSLLGNLPIHSLGSIVANVSFNSVFDCLSTDNLEEIEVCCDVLKKLLTPVPAQHVLTQFPAELHAGLKHDEIPVRRLCLAEVLRVSENCCEELMVREEVVIAVVRALADQSLEVAKCAERVLTNLGLREDGLAVLYGGDVMSSLQEVLASNDVIRFRVYETIVAICRQSDMGLQRSSESGLVQHFLNELHKDDILVQLNCLELLSDLATTEHGLLYLDGRGVMSSLETMMTNVQSDPLATFLVPGLMKFFGCVARLRPKEVCTRNEMFVTTVFDSLTAPDNPSMRSLAVQTVGFIGSSVEGKLALEKLGSRMDSGVRCLGKTLREGQQDAKVIVLQALTSLLKLKVSDQTTELLKLTEHWYGQLGTNTFGYLMSLAEQPFPDLRIALLILFESLASQPWAQTIMANHPGFREYLLNRSTEKTKECKEKKYNVVLTLANSPTVAEVFGNPYVVQLKVYCNQGPFFIRVQAEVAMEGDS
ncbi:26S proteasome non-ATPase regulatory subunit 5-like [Mya arenaria]|uniref:26S proteasome non-ATPase regulatory subunit 5-like n=1 Tax=Mya arenaria TaxID=6604 RepID=UPI0022E64DA5|nr:26S proteasome non-ATPase regulatory subunit 5-like [Mya arenaria]